MQIEQSAKYGCFTSVGIITALVTAFSIVGMALASGGQMFTAGDLNAKTGQTFGGVTSHAQITECSACHVAIWESATMSDRCLVCHENISAQLPDAKTLHGAIKIQNPRANCRDCHPEHRGAESPLTDLGGISFPHEALGFSLRGHQKTSANKDFACNDCHPDGVSTFSLSTCDFCHRQIDAAFTQAHTTAYGIECLACHDGVDRFGANFSHAAFPFKLDGKHAEVDCAKCHVNARNLANLQAAPQTCASCHEDEHQGRFGTDCAACHTTSAWTPAKFDHNLSVFKLDGKHVEVACASCHVNDVYQGTPQDCYSCHKNDDEHNGEFGTNCAACHNTNSWDDATVDHNLFAFKLDGSHTQVECIACHVNGVFKGTPTDCYSCHQADDEHQGGFGRDCAACHNTVRWGDATFDHNRSNFPLTGAHTRVACRDCHQNGFTGGTPTDCYSCHRNEDHGFGTNCVACHSTATWDDATFRHDAISPRHEGASCRDCHPNGYDTATCLACHDSNNPDDDDDDDDD